MAGKTTRKVIYEGVIPEKDVLPVYTRESGGATHVVIGAKGMYQVCRTCKNIKREDEFTIHSEIDRYCRRKLKNECKSCDAARIKLIRKLYAENGPRPSKCTLCGEEKNSIQLDHCHETNTFRGWLCNPCNTGLGKLKDDVAMLEKGIKYLKGELKHEKDIN